MKELQKTSFDVPAMYADHHVVEVRRILLETPGVLDVYASSAFRTVEVTFDPQVVNDLEITVKLDAAGYLGEWTPTTETTKSATEIGADVAFRHTAIYEQTRQVVGFSQQVSYQGRPLWPCPGLGVIRGMDEEV